MRGDVVIERGCTPRRYASLGVVCFQVMGDSRRCVTFLALFISRHRNMDADNPQVGRRLLPLRVEPHAFGGVVISYNTNTQLALE